MLHSIRGSYRALNISENVPIGVLRVGNRLDRVVQLSDGTRLALAKLAVDCARLTLDVIRCEVQMLEAAAQQQQTASRDSVAQLEQRHREELKEKLEETFSRSFPCHKSLFVNVLQGSVFRRR